MLVRACRVQALFLRLFVDIKKNLAQSIFVTLKRKKVEGKTMNIKMRFLPFILATVLLCSCGSSTEVSSQADTGGNQELAAQPVSEAPAANTAEVVTETTSNDAAITNKITIEDNIDLSYVKEVFLFSKAHGYIDFRFQKGLYEHCRARLHHPQFLQNRLLGLQSLSLRILFPYR